MGVPEADRPQDTQEFLNLYAALPHTKQLLVQALIPIFLLMEQAER